MPRLGSSMLAKMAMMAITTSSSIRVNANRRQGAEVPPGGELEESGQRTFMEHL